MEKEAFNRMFKASLPELLAGWSSDECRRDLREKIGVYTPPGLPILVPYGEDEEGVVQLARFDALRENLERAIAATSYLRSIGMPLMADRLAAEFNLTFEH